MSHFLNHKSPLLDLPTFSLSSGDFYQHTRITREIFKVNPFFWSYIEVLRRPKFSEQTQKSTSWIFDPLITKGNIYGLVDKNDQSCNHA